MFLDLKNIVCIKNLNFLGYNKKGTYLCLVKTWSISILKKTQQNPMTTCVSSKLHGLICESTLSNDGVRIPHK